MICGEYTGFVLSDVKISSPALRHTADLVEVDLGAGAGAGAGTGALGRVAWRPFATAGGVAA